MRDPASTDRGDTLLEVLLALLIVGLGVVALMAGLATGINGSATHQGLATVDSVLKSFAESATYQIELQTSPSPLFAQCAPVSGTSYNGTPINYNAPSGYTVSFDQSTSGYWSTSANALVPLSSCSPSTQSGFQVLSVTATGPKGVGSTLQFGVRVQ